MRQLRREISPEDLANVALERLHGEAKCKKSTPKYDVTSQDVLCTSCYFFGKPEYMHRAPAFGAVKTSETLPMSLMDRTWTRCLKCRAELHSSESPRNYMGMWFLYSVLPTHMVVEISSAEAAAINRAEWIWSRLTVYEHSACASSAVAAPP